MKVEIKRSHFAGSVYAECDCGWKCHYWEDPQELQHECGECKSCGGFSDVQNGLCETCFEDLPEGQWVTVGV